MSIVKKEAATPETLSSFRWIGLHKITYTDPQGVERQWETCQRTTRKGVADAVAIFATIRATASTPAKIILVSQFRPPVGNTVLEIPAGLIDGGETPEEAALRELKEETGYVGNITHSSPVLPNDAGMTDANLVFVYVDVDPLDERNINPQTEQEESEFITVHLVNSDNLLGELLRFKSTHGWDIDTKLYASCAPRAPVVSSPLSPAAPSWMPSCCGIPFCAAATLVLVVALTASRLR